MGSSKIKKLVQNIKFDKTAINHNRILKDAQNALENSQTSITEDNQNIWSMVLKSKLTKLTAAAVLVLMTTIFLTKDKPQETKPMQISKSITSPAELTTIGAMTFAYRNGGMESVEQLCDKAIAMAGPQPCEISLNELFSDLNNKIQKGKNYEK